MSIDSIRFRVEGELVVLQVMETAERDAYASYRNSSWRDAKVEDMLDVARFTRDYSSVEARISRLENDAAAGFNP